MPVEFLSDAEAGAYGRFDGSPSREELDRVFFLDDADRKLIGKRRGAPNQGSGDCWYRKRGGGKFQSENRVMRLRRLSGC